MHSFGCDAAATISDLHEIGDRNGGTCKTSLYSKPIFDSDNDRDDLDLHIHAAPKNEATQRREYQFAWRDAWRSPNPLKNYLLSARGDQRLDIVLQQDGRKAAHKGSESSEQLRYGSKNWEHSAQAAQCGAWSNIREQSR